MDFFTVSESANSPYRLRAVCTIGQPFRISVISGRWILRRARVRLAQQSGTAVLSKFSALGKLADGLAIAI